MERSDELKKFVVEIYNNFVNPEYFKDKIISGENALIIGSDEKEWTSGYEKVLTGLRKLAEGFRENGAKVVQTEPKVLVDGKIAWFNDQLTVEVNNAQVRMRSTGVIAKEGENWKIAQMHFSIGIPNKDTAFGDM